MRASASAACSAEALTSPAIFGCTGTISAGTRDRAGEFQIWAKDKGTGDDVAQLVPVGSPAFGTRMGGLKVQGDYPPEMVLAPCALPRPLVLIHRDDFKDPCLR